MGTMGRAEEPLKFLESLAKQTSPAYELFIIDQNEDERLAPVDAKAKELNIPTRRIKETIKNLAHARNIGIVKSTGDIIGFPDDDCWYEPDVLEQIHSCFKANPTIDAISGIWLEAPIQNIQPGVMPPKEIIDFKGARINSITLFIRRETLYELNGFDPRLGTGQWFGAGEEVDIALRLSLNGNHIYYTPEVKVHHPCFDTNDYSQIRIRSYSRGSGALYAKLDLSNKTIIRGLFSPILKIIFQPFSIRTKLNQTLGRVEGFKKWHDLYGSGKKSWLTHEDCDLFNTNRKD